MSTEKEKKKVETERFYVFYRKLLRSLSIKMMITHDDLPFRHVNGVDKNVRAKTIYGYYNKKEVARKEQPLKL